MRFLSALGLLAGLLSCGTEDTKSPVPQPSLIGYWRYVSLVTSSCSDPADDQSDTCTGSAAACGILALTENTWTWSQTLPDGSQSMETGSYTLSGNYFILSSAAVPGTKMYSISGSAISYTTTTLLFLNSSDATGCTYTAHYARYVQPMGPNG
jgi:hypothetical protein